MVGVVYGTPFRFWWHMWITIRIREFSVYCCSSYRQLRTGCIQILESYEI